MIVSDAPNCSVTYYRHYDDHNSFTIQATAYSVTIVATLTAVRKFDFLT